MQGGWSDEGRGGGYQGFYQEGGGHQGGGGGKEVTELKTIKGASRALVTLQEGIKAEEGAEEVVTNMTTTIKMAVATRTGVAEGVAGVGEEVMVEEEVMVGEEDRGEVGEGEGVRI